MRPPFTNSSLHFYSLFHPSLFSLSFCNLKLYEWNGIRIELALKMILYHYFIFQNLNQSEIASLW